LESEFDTILLAEQWRLGFALFAVGEEEKRQ
jgi:hypothetical protein